MTSNETIYTPTTTVTENSSIWITLLALASVFTGITLVCVPLLLVFILKVTLKDSESDVSKYRINPFWARAVFALFLVAVCLLILLVVIAPFGIIISLLFCSDDPGAVCQGFAGSSFSIAGGIFLCSSFAIFGVILLTVCRIRHRRLNSNRHLRYSSSFPQSGPGINHDNFGLTSEQSHFPLTMSLSHTLVSNSSNHDYDDSDSDAQGSRDCLLPQTPTEDDTVPTSRKKTFSQAEGFPELASENTESCKMSESVQSSLSSANFKPFSGAQPVPKSQGGLMPESLLRRPFSCLTAGGGSSSLCTYDPDPPDYCKITQLSRLQNSHPSVWEPEHLCESGTFNIWDSQLASDGQRQEVAVMPKKHPSSPSLSKIAIPEQLHQSCFILGDIHTISLTHQGGAFPLYPCGQPKGAGKPECCATLEAPLGVVERGVSLCIHYAIILDGPFKFPENWKRTSVVLYIDCPDNHLMLEPVKLSLHHWAAVGPSSSMSFMKSNHFLEKGQNEFQFEHHAIFFPSNTRSRVANLDLKNHFCLVCTAVDEFEVGMSRYYGMLVMDPLKDGVQKFWLCLTYAVPTWIQAVKEYFRKEEENEKRVLPECQELELGSDDKVSLVVQTMSGAGWALTVTKKEIWLKKVNEIFSKYPSCKTKKRAVLCGQYPPTVHFKITYETDPSPATHVRKPNSATLSSNADSVLHFTVHEKINSSSGVDVNPSMVNPARASLTDSSYSSGYEEDSFQHLKATKEFTLQNLMIYLNDLADVGRQIAGWLGMEHEFSVLGKTHGIRTPQDLLQELLTQWLKDSEWPTAPHDWEFFIRVVRGVNKGKLAERIKKEIFKEPDQTASLHSVEDYQDLHHSDIADVSLTDSPFVAWGDHELMDPSTFKDEVSDISEECISHLAEEMASYWFVFGRKLGFSDVELQSIRESNDCGNVTDSEKACCSVMLHRWVRISNQKEKTHDRLQHAVTEAKAVEFEPPTYSDVDERAFST